MRSPLRLPPSRQAREEKATGGIRLPTPLDPATLVEVYGGSLDVPASTAPITRVVAAGQETMAGCLVPVFRVAAIAAVRLTPALLLVDAVLAPRVPPGRRWVHPHAAWVLAEILAPAVDDPRADERSRAHLETGAVVPLSARIGIGCVIRAGAVLGEHCHLEPYVVVHPRVRLGERVRVGSAAILGQPGFGWVTGPQGAVRRMPHGAGVIIEDDADIGAHVTIDAGVLTPTRIGRRTRLDAHVHVAHNATIGPDSFVAAQAGFAGSVQVGARVRVGGQAGVADHVRIGDGAQLAAKAGVIGHIPAGIAVAGYPAVPRWRWLRGVARLLAKRS